MPRIVIVGNSAAGYGCAAALETAGFSGDCLLVSREGAAVYRRDLLPDYIGAGVRHQELFLSAAKERLSVAAAVTEKAEVVRVDARRQRIVLKDNSRIPYEFLVLASGRSSRLPDLPGKGKEGVVTFNTLEDAESIRARATLAHTVILAGEAAACARLCAALSRPDKEIKIVSAAAPEGFVADEAREWIAGLQITELIGEGVQLRAARLSSNKVIGTSLVIFANAPQPNTEFARESGICLEDGYVCTDEAGRTNLATVFACGSAARSAARGVVDSWDAAVEDGRRVAATIKAAIEGSCSTCQQTS